MMTNTLIDGFEFRVAGTMPWAQVVKFFRLETMMDSITHSEPQITLLSDM